MNLYEFALVSLAFPVFEAPYQRAYYEFLQATKPNFDMRDPDHRWKLLKWLNKWGCRNFEVKFRDKISERLGKWFQNAGLPSQQKGLVYLSTDEISRAASVYERLRNEEIPCATRRMTIGCTAASKILFAIMKNVYPIWDDGMREYYDEKGCSTYIEYMTFVKKELLALKDQCRSHGIDLRSLPAALNRKDESLLKLLDEYHWVKSREWKPVLPSIEELQRWA